MKLVSKGVHFPSDETFLKILHSNQSDSDLILCCTPLFFIESQVENSTVRVKCLAQEHNTMVPARARLVSVFWGERCVTSQKTAAEETRARSTNQDHSICNVIIM